MFSAIETSMLSPLCLGCGRYSLQHAERHYRRSGHQLSLDLASGCIWDYGKDCFAHIEDPASLTHRGGETIGY